MPELYTLILVLGIPLFALVVIGAALVVDSRLSRPTLKHELELVNQESRTRFYVKVVKPYLYQPLHRN